MSSADRSLVEAMFRALAVAQTGKAGYAKIDASTPDGISGIVFLAVPDWVWLQTVEPALRKAGVTTQRLREDR